MNSIGIVLLTLISLPLALHANDTTSDATAPTLAFSYIETGQSNGAQEAVVVKSGSWFTQRQLIHGAILVVHNEESFLFDTGLGTQVDQQFSENNWWAKALFAYTKGIPIIEQFEKYNYDASTLMAIIPSHLHWDHASGIVDFPEVPIWVQQTELEAAKTGDAPSFLQSQLGAASIKWKLFALEDKPFLGFSRSLDIFDDASVVLVDLSGHTAGQVGLFLNISATQQYFFIGDTTWTLKGVEDKSPRPAMLKLLVNLEHDQSQSDQRILQVNKLLEDNPNLTIVPAHDELVAATLPHFPKFIEN